MKHQYNCFLIWEEYRKGVLVFSKRNPANDHCISSRHNLKWPASQRGVDGSLYLEKTSAYAYPFSYSMTHYDIQSPSHTKL